MQKTPPGMNRRRLVEAAAATAAVSTLGLPSLVLAEESSFHERCCTAEGQ